MTAHGNPVCVLIGSDTLLIECGELWLKRGFRVDAVVTDTPRVSDWARRAGIDVIDAGSDYATALSARSFDYLFAITFLRIIPDAVLKLPRRAAINFHDGPLPRYAGLNAPTWAILNREREYGITWHVMSAEVDRGDILKQVGFEVSDDETSLSLNTRCFGAAIESFGELVDELSTGSEQRTPQPAAEDGAHAYFGRHARPPAAAVVDWNAPAQHIAAMVRAFDFGPRYPNMLGAATAFIADRTVVISAAEASLEQSAAAPGTVIAMGQDSISVACGEGVLLVRGLRSPCGSVLPIQALAERIVVPSQLESLSEADRAKLTELDQALSRAERFWTKRLLLDATELPFAQQPSAYVGEPDYREQSLHIPESFATKFSDDNALVAAWAAFTARLSGQEQAVLALADEETTSAALGFDRLVATTLPFVVETESAESFSALVSRVAAERAQIHARKGFLRNLGVRYPELTETQAVREPGRLPIGVALGVDAPAGFAVQLRVAHGRAVLRYEPGQVTDQAAAHTAQLFEAFVANLSAASDAPVARVDLLSPEARNQQLVVWNRTERELPAGATIHGLIEAQVDRTPDAVALACEDVSFTFRELDAAANRVAARLIAAGATLDMPVGIHVHRSAELVIAALGALKAGAAYVPLDPAYPADRVALMIEDAKLKIVVAEPALAPALVEKGVQVVALDEELLRSGPNSERPNVAVSPQNLAYLIYTSGSTGRPKGVMLEHGNAVNFFVGMDERVAKDPTGVWLAVTSLSFDISVLELWWTLSHGFKVVVHADRARASAATSRHAAAEVARPVEFSFFYFSADANAEPGARYRLLLEGAKFADEHGFSAVWTPERHFHAFGGLYPNPAVTGAAVAAVTKRVGIRAGSVVLPLHHPARVAEQWAVVDNISNGRVGVSVASGWQPNDFVFRPENFKSAKAVMMRDVELVKRLWRGETIEFEGPLGPVPVTTLPRPVQKELPVWITTAGNQETFEMAGAAGANVLTHLLGQTLEQLAPKLAAYRKARAAAGFDPSTGIVSLMLHTFVGPDREQVKDFVREPLKAYLGTSMDLIKDKAWTFPAFRRPKGFKADEPGNELAELSEEDRDALLTAAFERYFELSGLFGTPDDALETVYKLKRIGVDDVACLIDFGVDTDLVLQHLPYLDQVRSRELEQRNAQLAVGAPAQPVLPESDEHPFLLDVERHGVTHLQCTPSMARMFLGSEETRRALGKIQHIFLGGEALPADLLADLRAASNATITNMYGPTETTVWSTTHRVLPSDVSVPIGTPIANTTLYITDDKQRPLPAGVAGELWIGGKGVARGYWERPDLTAERFVPDPFSSEPGARMYRTGDRARYRPDGVVEFLGRADFQVKLRGYRIELGEIEAIARKVQNVAESVVIVREDRPGDQRLVAYLVPVDGTQVDVGAVRDALRVELPEYMVPAALMVIPSLPLTPNRKIDRKALPAPDNAGEGGAQGEGAAPESEIEIKTAAVWREILGRDSVGVDDNFFDSGGHSLLVVRMHRKLQEVLGRPLALTDLYRFPTIRTFCAFLSEGGTADSKKASARGARRREMMQRRGG